MFNSLPIEEECKKKPNSERAVFEHLQDDLSEVLQGNIISVAAAAFSCGLIASGVRNIVTDGTASHAKLLIIQVLNQIHQAIVTDPGNLKIFIKEVLKKAIGAPVQHLIDELGEH